MLKAMRIMAISKNLPLAVLIPRLKYSGSLKALPNTIPKTSAKSIALKPNTLLRSNADTAIASDKETPLTMQERAEVFNNQEDLLFCLSGVGEDTSF